MSRLLTFPRNPPSTWRATRGRLGVRPIWHLHGPSGSEEHADARDSPTRTPKPHTGGSRCACPAHLVPSHASLLSRSCDMVPRHASPLIVSSNPRLRCSLPCLLLPCTHSGSLSIPCSLPVLQHNHVFGALLVFPLPLLALPPFNRIGMHTPSLGPSASLATSAASPPPSPAALPFIPTNPCNR